MAIQGCWGVCFVLTPRNSCHIPTAGAALFHPLNQDISFPIVGEKNRLLQLQAKRHLPLNDFFPLIPLLPHNDSCLVVATARTNITGRTDSLVLRGCTCALALLKTFIPPFFKRGIYPDPWPGSLVSVHRWKPHFSFGETEDPDVHLWTGFTELGNGLDKGPPPVCTPESSSGLTRTYNGHLSPHTFRRGALPRPQHWTNSIPSRTITLWGCFQIQEDQSKSRPEGVSSWFAANKMQATHHKFTCTPSIGNSHKIITLLFAEPCQRIENQDKKNPVWHKSIKHLMGKGTRVSNNEG